MLRLSSGFNIGVVAGDRGDATAVADDALVAVHAAPRGPRNRVFGAEWVTRCAASFGAAWEEICGGTPVYPTQRDVSHAHREIALDLMWRRALIIDPVSPLERLAYKRRLAVAHGHNLHAEAYWDATDRSSEPNGTGMLRRMPGSYETGKQR